MPTRQPAICPALGFGGFNSLTDPAACVQTISTVSAALAAQMQTVFNAGLADVSPPLTAVASVYEDGDASFTNFDDSVEAPAIMTRVRKLDYSPLHTFYNVVNPANPDDPTSLYWLIEVKANLEATAEQARAWAMAATQGSGIGRVPPLANLYTALDAVCNDHGWAADTVSLIVDNVLNGEPDPVALDIATVRRGVQIRLLYRVHIYLPTVGA